MPTATLRRVDDEMLRRCGDLKRELVDFAQHNRFGRAYRQMLREQSGGGDPLDEFFTINMFDYFALQHRLHDGRTVVERFVSERRRLTDDERALLLGWRDVALGVFEVETKDDGALVTVNMLDELGYRIYSNFGHDFLDPVPQGAFLVARVVPLGEDWLISGAVSVLPADEAPRVYRTVAELAIRDPATVFRNPDKLARGWELQRAERRVFVEFFGSDLVVMPGSEVAARMRAYMHYRMHEKRDADGRSIADSSRERYGTVPAQPDFSVAELADAATVAAVYDEIGGLMFWGNFGDAEDAFANPELASTEPYRSTVLGYLEEDSISPVALRRLAERDPASATYVFRAVLDRPDFLWSRDGEALLREYKSTWFEQPALPCVTVLSDQVADAVLAQS